MHIYFQAQIGLFPVEYAKNCAKAMVQAVRQGERCLTVPPWFSTMYLWRVFAPEVVEFCYRLLYMQRHGGSQADAPSKKMAEASGKKLLYPTSLRSADIKDEWMPLFFWAWSSIIFLWTRTPLQVWTFHEMGQIDKILVWTVAMIMEKNVCATILCMNKLCSNSAVFWTDMNSASYFPLNQNRHRVGRSDHSMADQTACHTPVWPV